MSIKTALVTAACFASLMAFGPAQAVAQEVFPTPEAAGQALVDAASHPGQGLINRIFGPKGSDLLSSGDEQVDKQRMEDFLALAAKGSATADGAEGRKILTFGTDGWGFPIPLKPATGGWTFDLAAGQQAITDRTVGRNELSAIGACADYVAAQKEYFASLHDDDPVQQYARRILSTPGRHDGLWWASEGATDVSPLGDRIASDAVKGGSGPGKPGSYHGYIYRILTRQGPSARGGAYDYLVKGRLLAGFALVAYPETWGKTGVMTFLCDQYGQVYERNFGPGTSTLAAGISILNPHSDWKPLEN